MGSVKILSYSHCPVSLALEVTGHESVVLVGLPRDINCSTHLEVTRMEWVLAGVSDPVEEREDGGQSLTLSLNPTDTGLDGAVFTCKVTTARGKTFQETITIEVKGRITSFLT